MVGAPSPSVRYETRVVGAGILVKRVLDRLGVVTAIDQALAHQPVAPTTYGALAQVVIVNRLTLNPQPLYQLGPWAQEHGIDQLLELDAAWLDDDRLGALLDAVAAQQVPIWTTVLQNALSAFAVDLEWLREDTTSIYFEGAYAAAPGVPKGGEAARIPRLVEGYNKDGKRGKVQYVLSLLTGGPTGRLPVWYRPWNGNQTDEPVYVADLSALRQTLLAPDNAVLLGDRKLCTAATMLTCCRQGQQFLAPHPWTDTAKAVWTRTAAALATAPERWTTVAYTSRNQARRAPAERPEQRVYEVPQPLLDPTTGTSYLLRWLFTWSSTKAAQDAARRAKQVAAGERALTRLAGLLGKYDYKQRATIEARLEQALRPTHAQAYFAITLSGTDADQAWALHWEVRTAALEAAARFDGVVLLCTNVPAARCTAAALVIQHKSQIGVEQTIDFLKSPVQIRPLWLHSPTRLAGLTLLIMLAVLVAALLEHQVRQELARTGTRLRGLRPEGRDDPYPTAKALLRAFSAYACVLVYPPEGTAAVHYPALHPVQAAIWACLALPPLPGHSAAGGSGK